jgi:hypothetical protein
MIAAFDAPKGNLFAAGPAANRRLKSSRQGLMASA